MLRLNSKNGNKIHIGNDVVMWIEGIDDKDGSYKLCFEAPRSVCIDRASVRQMRIESVKKNIEK